MVFYHKLRKEQFATGLSRLMCIIHAGYLYLFFGFLKEPDIPAEAR